MSNLSDFLTAVGLMTGDGSEYVEAAGAAIGLLADASGSIPLLVDIITGKEGSSSDDLRNQLTVFFQLVISQLNQLKETLTAGQIQQLQQNAAASLNAAETWVGQIPADAASNNLPLPQLVADQRQADCRRALLNLFNESSWKLPQYDQQYFQPANRWLYSGWALYPGSTYYFPFFYHDNQADVYSLRFVSSFAPDTHDGFVFTYTLALQEALRALYDYLAVCSTSVPNFPRDGSSNYDLVNEQGENFVGKLLAYHDKIVEGIVNLIPPGVDETLPCRLIGDDRLVIAADAASAPSRWQVATVNWTDWPRYMRNTLAAPPSEYARPFGALCIYTGYVANYNSSDPAAPPTVDNYPTYKLPARYDGSAWPGVPDAQPWYIGFYGKYLLRSLRRKKDVYRGLGLPAIWDLINRVRTIYGMPPVRRGDYASNFRDWSVREVFKLLGAGQGNPQLTQTSLRALSQFVKDAAPEMAQAPTSLRLMLEA
jgi:hypothetical protein